MSEKNRPDLFPIMPGIRRHDEVDDFRRHGVKQIIIAIPWEILLGHEEQAKSNHGGQTLKRLAERGGLSPCEAVAILEGRRWHSMPGGAAHTQLAAKLARFDADCARAEAEAEFRATDGF